MEKRTPHKPFSASLKAKLRNKTFKEAFEHYSNTLSVGLLIRDTRIKSGLTQKEFSARMGVSQQVISRLEKGEVDNPTIDTLSKIADVAGKKLVVEFV
jgi:ribosome-binding protein aMBF1 (putative translation factor)